MTRKLYDFQEQAVCYHLAHHYSINASSMGTGKSLMALETARRAGGKIAVFAPPFLRMSWESEAKAVGVEFKFFPYSMLHKVDPSELKGFSFWIADELHFLKSPTARRTHAFYAAIKAVPPEYFIGLTGTPIKNRLPDFWTLLAFCGVNPKRTSGLVLTGELRKFRAFSRYFCHTLEMRAGGRRIEKFGEVKADKIPELKALLKDKFIRFRVEDVLKDLPEMTRKEVTYNLSASVEVGSSFATYMSGGKTDITAKTTSALLKAPLTAEYCNMLREGGSGPLLVFTDHVASAQAIAAAVAGAVAITGQTPVLDRMRMVSAFQDGKIEVIVATIGSLSVGVTLTAARHVVFNDLSWVPADNLQAEKRIHRIGQKNACFSHFIDATPTDTHIRKTLYGKLETINKVIG